MLYLTLNWQDDEKQTLFDAGERIPDEIYNFIEEAIENHESVLIQSIKAQNRACFVIGAWLMRRYRWSFMKTLEFLDSRRPDLEMRPSFLRQLQMYEASLSARGLGPKTQKWTEISDTATYHLENDELILRNTFLNSKSGPVFHDYSNASELRKKDKLVWRDLSSSNAQQLCEENRDCDDLVNLSNPPKQMNHYNKPPNR